MASLSPPDWLEARGYQTEAVSAWLNAQGQGVFNMATGTGKTITSLLAASELHQLQDERLALIVAAPYQHLVDQWTEELVEFGAAPFRAYESRNKWMDEITGAITEFSAGVRNLLTIVTTHHTFASDHFQKLLNRLDGTQTMLIADEVHHLGAPHLRTGLPSGVRARLGLSATPERWYDEEGTNALYRYFSNGVVYEYGLAEAIENGFLCEYYYVPHIINFTPDEAEEYVALSRAIGRRIAQNSGEVSDADFQTDETLKQMLFKRSRMVGTAENKLHTLRSLLKRIGPEDIHHSLIYCGDGQVEAEGEDVKRQLEAITELVGNELGVRAHQFTYEEDQETRERLLADFEDETLQALVAIRCLDEGVDVPATETAFMLASSSNPRQFVQRRGRILRTHQNKQHAVIHDFIVAPPQSVRNLAQDDNVFNIERRLVKSELERVATFTEHALNHPDAELSRIPTTAGSLTDLKNDFNLMDV